MTQRGAITNARDEFSIGTLARASGVKIETIRFYERRGLVAAPPRDHGGRRRYGLQHLRRMIFVRRGRELGFGLDEIAALLSLSQDARPCADVTRIARANLDRVEAALSDLRRMRRVLRKTLSQCADANTVHCPILETLGTSAKKSPDQRGQSRL